MIDVSPEKMSVAEKLSLMETIWNDLCDHSQIDSPDWHQNVLSGREKSREQGKQAPMDWSEAKELIRHKVK